MGRDSSTERVYARELPGGGFVAIDVHAVRLPAETAKYIGMLVVERRSPARRPGHEPPVVVETDGPSVPAILQQLLPIALHNHVLGAALLRFDSRQTSTPVLM